MNGRAPQPPLRRSTPDPARERDACGIGFVADEAGRRSHRVLELALEALAGLDHRGAVGADGQTSDGTGVMLHLPHALLWREMERLGLDAADAEDSDLAVAMCFLPRDDTPAALRLVGEAVAGYGLRVVGWRPVPTDPRCLGPLAYSTRPAIGQVILARTDDALRRACESDPDAYERRLYLCRRRIEKAAAEADIDLTLSSLSSRTVVYKSMARAADLALFYPDLRDPDVRTGFALFHQRFSTNTQPSWRLAQPFRLLAHNGEINTIQGNVHWMSSRETEMRSHLFGEDIADLLPVLDPTASDSAQLDQALELLVRGGRDPMHSLMMLIPEARSAWAEETGEDADALRAFYEVHQSLLEPWDGPAAIVASDGRVAVAALDRNGLRPQRYWRTVDGLVIVGSEAGMVALPQTDVVEKGRLGPGQMLAVDLEGSLVRAATGRSSGVLRDAEIKSFMARKAPWRERLERVVVQSPAPETSDVFLDQIEPADLLRTQRVFGWSKEALERILDPMIEGKQPVGSMGNDAPLAVLSTQPQLLYSYFKQRFAQVTNPPIDPLRERLVFDLDVFVGAWGNLFDEPLSDEPLAQEPATDERDARGKPSAVGRLIRFPSPVLSPGQYRWLRDQAGHDAFRTVELDCTWPVSEGVDGLRTAVERLEREAADAVEDGAVLLLLSDRNVGPERAQVPMLLATSAVHHRLVRAKTRMRASLVCDTGEPREDHHVACLLGFGATLVYPRLAYASVRARAAETDHDPARVTSIYRETLGNGLLKVLSRLGVCPMASYHGAQLFEALGLDEELVDQWFPGTPSRVGGVGPKVLASDVLTLHAEAFAVDGEGETPAEGKLVDRGYFRYRRKGEEHDFAPGVFTTLHKAVRTQDAEVFQRYAKLVDRGRPTRLRDLMALREAPERLDLADVEPAADIARRFVTAAMSLGALSREAHEVLAVGMNRLGAKSNSGEGGEDEIRHMPYTQGRIPTMGGPWQPEPGDWACSAVKQIASGRFGVTPYYLTSAQELEIKMAQGSKPGEGGQIPGHKVTEEIARLRKAVPGMKLISPPPHHDIYSIEDLAQLIYDLKRVNARARVGVKLVSLAGVGTIASGVVKAGADYVQISGDDGGTGASPLSSIKHAGMPWELGLAETQRTLVASGLRDRVTLRVDGGLKTGRDIVVGALLGAEEFGFGTASLVAVGCVMARQCHLNTCPVGIATQRDELRAKFPGTPEQVVSFMLFVAEQVRHELARLGVQRLKDLVGRFDLLEPREDRAPVRGLHLDRLLRDPDPTGLSPRRGLGGRNPLPDERTSLDERLWRQTRRAVENGQGLKLFFDIRNSDRAVGARLSGEIAQRNWGKGLDDGAIRVDFYGAAGQSFGVWLSPGMDFRLWGEAQDYVGKGMAGGRLVLRLPEVAELRPDEQVIAGNTLLYGATGGELFAAGRVGERFAVRNSGARAVVEGCGDHGCEYMTGGTVVILGDVGRNFGAGMGGGVAWIWDPKRTSVDQLHEDVQWADDGDFQELRRLLRDHADCTGSPRAREILRDWPLSRDAFVRVVSRFAPRVESAAVASGKPASATVA